MRWRAAAVMLGTSSTVSQVTSRRTGSYRAVAGEVVGGGDGETVVEGAPAAAEQLLFEDSGEAAGHADGDAGERPVPVGAVLDNLG